MNPRYSVNPECCPACCADKLLTACGETRNRKVGTNFPEPFLPQVTFFPKSRPSPSHDQAPEVVPPEQTTGSGFRSQRPVEFPLRADPLRHSHRVERRMR